MEKFKKGDYVICIDSRPPKSDRLYPVSLEQSGIYRIRKVFRPSKGRSKGGLYLEEIKCLPKRDGKEAAWNPERFKNLGNNLDTILYSLRNNEEFRN